MPPHELYKLFCFATLGGQCGRHSGLAGGPCAHLPRWQWRIHPAAMAAAAALETHAVEQVLGNPDLVRLILLAAPTSAKACACAVAKAWREEATPLVAAALGPTWEAAYIARFWSRAQCAARGDVVWW